jgi:hypothetical protein
MHPWGPPFSPNVAATLAEAEAVGMGVDDAVDAVETVHPEPVMKVCAPIAKLTIILQMHAESAKACRREETMEMMSGICFQCGLPGHVKVDCVFYKRKKEWWKVKRATATAALATTGDCDPF